MPPIFEQHFAMHSVGQGLFYSGLIRINNNLQFRMVFDCGSINPIQCSASVQKIRHDFFLNDKILDLLVVSHFDEDHVSHLKELVGSDVKIKKLVIPFLCFEERLILALRLVMRNNGSNGIGPSLRFIIDPLGELNDNLDDGSEVILITKGPDGPPQNREQGQSGEWNSETQVQFDFFPSDKQTVSNANLSILHFVNKRNNIISQVADNNVGYVGNLALTSNLMEFIFYRRNIGVDEEKFFRRVCSKFLNRFKINKKLKPQAYLNKVKATIIAQKNATNIKKIFKESIGRLNVRTVGRRIDDLNTLALSMLHRNLPGVWATAGIRDDDEDKWRRVRILPHNFESAWWNDNRRFYPYPYWMYLEYIAIKGNFYFPNTLLTSDGFLKRADEVKPFFDRYSSYWNDFAYFQVPHHGSKNNSGIGLFAQIPLISGLLVNYGTTHKHAKTWLHPDTEVIQNITAAGHSTRLIAVNEFQKCEYSFSII